MRCKMNDELEKKGFRTAKSFAMAADPNGWDAEGMARGPDSRAKSNGQG